MKINIEIENLAEFNFFYNTLMLGVLTAIQHHKISPQDGEQQIFSHMSIDRLKHSPFHPSFSDLVWQGSEIEDFDNDERTERKEWLATMQNTILNNYKDASLKPSFYNGCQITVQTDTQTIKIK